MWTGPFVDDSKNGGACPKVVEHPVVGKRSHLAQWKRQMAEHFNVGQSTIKHRLYGLDHQGRKKKV